MKLFGAIFGFLGKRLFTKFNISIFLIIFLVLILMALDGKNLYLSKIKNIKDFQEMEANKVNQFVYYDQYANYGLKILFIHSPFVILNSDSFLNETMANINIGERLNISSYLTHDLSDDKSGYMDFFGILLMSVISISLFWGFIITFKEDFLGFSQQQNIRFGNFLKYIGSTILLLNIVFIIMAGGCLLLLYANGINLFSGFFIIIVEVFLNTIFFVHVGAVVGNLKRKKSTRKIILIGLIFICVFLIPFVNKKFNQVITPTVETVSAFEFLNFKLLMAAERRIFNEIGTYKNDGNPAPDNIKQIVEGLKKGLFKDLIKNENKRREVIIDRIKLKQTILSLFPVTFSISINNELSSCGGRSFYEFLSYAQILKDNFKDFILKEKFYKGAKPGKVESFLGKGPDKNIFYAKSYLPFNFWLGFFLSIFYTVLILLFLVYSLKKGMRTPVSKKTYRIENEKDNPVFVLCENNKIKNNIFHYYKNQDNAVCLEKINTNDFNFPGIKLEELFYHLCSLHRAPVKKALENIGILGVRDFSIFEKGDENIRKEVILKIYAAVLTAGNFEIIVLDDFAKKESRKFELELFKLLSQMVRDGKKIIYLSCTMMLSVNSVVNNIKVSNFRTFPLKIADTDTTLR